MDDALHVARERVLGDSDLFLEVLRPLLPDFLEIEARFGTEDSPNRLQLASVVEQGFKLRLLSKDAKAAVDLLFDAFMKHVHDQFATFMKVTHDYVHRTVYPDHAQMHRYTVCQLTRASVWPSFLLNAEPLPNDCSVEQMNKSRKPQTMIDIYNLLAERCAICGTRCRYKCRAIPKSQPVWMQRSAPGSGEYISFTSYDHFVEVCFTEARPCANGQWRPSMQLRVNTHFKEVCTVHSNRSFLHISTHSSQFPTLCPNPAQNFWRQVDYIFLDFLASVRKTPNYEDCILQLFQRRRAACPAQAAGGFIAHLPLFNLKLKSSWPADSSIASIFNRTDAQMAALTRSGGRIATQTESGYWRLPCTEEDYAIY